jgi:hypothetical protein
MPHCPIVCHLANGKTYRSTTIEAEEMVRDDHAEWIDRRNIRLKREYTVQVGLSCRVGATLACAVQSGEGWARTMLSEIQR